MKDINKMTLPELLDYYGDCKAEANKLYKQFKDLQPNLHELSLIVMDKLRENDLKSIKTSKYGVSITKRKDIAITSEKDAEEWLKNQPEIETDAYYGLKVTPFKQLVTKWFSKTGEIPNGTDITTKESITVRKANK